ncbi:MAG: DUF3784 domain-containing protein [Defluviitaleaceae bacterium]|nr:DUF3784 domain-containing protein [Defluviitaleaceae bacterium]
MIWAILMGVLGVFLWVLTIAALKGVDWIFISGVSTLPKEDRQKYKEKHDMPAMNKYIGKRVFLPSAVFVTASIPIMLFPEIFEQALWLAAVIVIACIALLVSIFSALPKILGGHFEKRQGL